MYLSIYIYIYTYTYTCVCMYTYIRSTKDIHIHTSTDVFQQSLAPAGAAERLSFTDVVFWGLEGLTRQHRTASTSALHSSMRVVRILECIELNGQMQTTRLHEACVDDSYPS